MRTARLLNVSQHALCRGVSAQGGGVSNQGGYLPGGRLPGGVSAQGGGRLPHCEQNDTQV